jgi:hypothetical protein
MKLWGEYFFLVWRKESVMFSKVKCVCVCILFYLLVAYLMMLSIAETTQYEMIGWFMNNEYGRMCS